MNKDTVLSILRALMTAGGSYIVGHNLFGHQVDASVWQEVAGSVIALVGAIWGVVDKTAGIEGVQSAVRSFLQSAGGFLTAAGVITGETLNAILGLATAIISVLQSHLSKVKVKQIADGTVNVSADTGKVTPAPPKIK